MKGAVRRDYDARPYPTCDAVPVPDLGSLWFYDPPRGRRWPRYPGRYRVTYTEQVPSGETHRSWIGRVVVNHMASGETFWVFTEVFGYPEWLPVPLLREETEGAV